MQLVFQSAAVWFSYKLGLIEEYWYLASSYTYIMPQVRLWAQKERGIRKLPFHFELQFTFHLFLRLQCDENGPVKEGYYILPAVDGIFVAVCATVWILCSIGVPTTFRLCSLSGKYSVRQSVTFTTSSTLSLKMFEPSSKNEMLVALPEITWVLRFICGDSVSIG